MANFDRIIRVYAFHITMIPSCIVSEIKRGSLLVDFRPIPIFRFILQFVSCSLYVVPIVTVIFIFSN